MWKWNKKIFNYTKDEEISDEIYFLNVNHLKNTSIHFILNSGLGESRFIVVRMRKSLFLYCV